ncbi:MAG: hypothetical protein HQL82_04885 [Magnetococcales bacterium]|nr:hypothetical protein [Magnetococcales bacterium]
MESIRSNPTTPPPEPALPRSLAAAWKLLLAAWLASLLFGSLVLFPRGEEMVHYLPALTLWAGDHATVDPDPGAAIGSLPAQSRIHVLLQAGFLKVQELLHWPPGYYGYRFFQMGVVLITLLLALALLRAGHPLASRDDHQRRWSLFLVLVAVTPFGADWALVGPAMLALASLLGGLLLWYRPTAGRRGWARLAGMGSLLGASALIHPAFPPLAVPAALLIAFLEWRREEDFFPKPAFFVATFLLPALLLAACHLAGPGGGALVELPSVPGRPVLATQWSMMSGLTVAGVLHYVPYGLMLAAVGVWGWRRDDRRFFALERDPCHWILLGGTGLVLLFMDAAPGLDGVLGLLVPLLLVSSSGTRLWSLMAAGWPVRWRALLLGLGVILILSWPLVNWIRHGVAVDPPGEPFRVARLPDRLVGKLDRLFIAAPAFVPFFAGQYLQSLRGEGHYVVQILPPVGDAGLEVGTREQVKTWLLGQSGASGVTGWLVSGAREGQQICLDLDRLGLVVHLQAGETLYRDRDHVLLTTSSGFTVAEGGCPGDSPP